MRRRLTQLFWLTVVWVLLWGTLSPATIVGGVIVAGIVTWLFPLPPMRDHVPLRPLRLLALAGYMAVDMFRSAAGVAWEAVWHGPRARAGIVAVPLLSGSARAVALIAGAVTLSPGSYVLQIDRGRGTFWVYALGMRGEGDVERVRRAMLLMQRKVIAAVGTAGELADCDRGIAAAGTEKTP
ncbi:Na+/H+ antiporter subunit E [Pseudonocardia sp. N23]|uniref:Na+/H+ antiporter subunit E n=1 Tax=Pseudonocardia sp. N23 TaxID=1987376 RepID=UPI000BFBAB28|nr:Na+/H+ antiporter subunit E [Pseudonocardia sp. N23]GAY07830.1 Na(+) H(+) antiporter subunit E [Pseudonocardia sp. N23]